MIPVVMYPAVSKFLDGLAAEVRNDTNEVIQLLREYGRLLPPPDSKKVSKRIFELRVQSFVQVRLLYGFIDGKAFVVQGFIKKSDKLPLRELRLAEKRFSELA